MPWMNKVKRPPAWASRDPTPEYQTFWYGAWWEWFRPDTLVIRSPGDRWTLIMRPVQLTPWRGQMWTPHPGEGFYAMLRKIQQTAGEREAVSMGDPRDVADYPTLWEYLSVASYPDGSPRQLSALVIVAEASAWKGCLSDKDNARVLWKTGETIPDLLAALELAAASDDPREWRRVAPEPKRRR